MTDPHTVTIRPTATKFSLMSEHGQTIIPGVDSISRNEARVPCNPDKPIGDVVRSRLTTVIYRSVLVQKVIIMF